MISIVTKLENGIIQRRPMTAITEQERLLARRKFDSDYVKALGPSFDAEEWVLNDQKQKYHIRFHHRYSELAACCLRHQKDPDDLILDLKTMVLLKYGTCHPQILRGFVKFTIDEFIHSDCFTRLEDPLLHSARDYLSSYLDFIQLIGADEAYIEFCRNRLIHLRADLALQKSAKKPCTMNEFVSYFRFDDIIRTWWEEETDSLVKGYFFPLFLYWVITTILPMRVTEFCVTPYDCLRKNGKLCYLTIRRSRLKGSSSNTPKIRSYRLDADYSTHEYEIPENIYRLIEEYKDQTGGFAHAQDTLFSADYAIWCKVGTLRTHGADVAFTGDDMNVLLKDFYDLIITDRFRYHLVTEDELLTRYMDETGAYEMAEAEIMKFQLKHTRHLAMINLIMRGCSPTMIREFAGHADEAISANYYGNISKTVRCATKQLYDKVKNRRSSEKGIIRHRASVNPLSLLIDESAPFIEVDRGRCYSEAFLGGDCRDCREVDGDCDRCRHLIRNAASSSAVEEKTAVRVDQEMEYLLKLLRSDRLESKITEFNLLCQQAESDIAGLAVQIWQRYRKGEFDGQKI